MEQAIEPIEKNVWWVIPTKLAGVRKPLAEELIKVLANESRLKLVGLLAQREHSVEELAAMLQLKEPTVSHHLTKLKELNLVKMRPDGNTHFYQLNQDALQELSKAVFSPSQMATFAIEVNDDAWEEKVLGDSQMARQSI